MQNIKKYFDKARLPLFLTDKSIGRFNTEVGNKVFQMTIDKRGRTESFRIFKGSIKNDIRVIDLEPKKSQLLLYVKEPRRTFTTVQRDWETKKDIKTDHITPEGIRRYLMGMDERHLFISELPDNAGKVNKVADAFRILKPREVKDRKKRKKIKTFRQGEWFFVKATPAELIKIKEKIHLVNKRAPIESSRGSSHIAEELLRIDEEIFIRGKIRHEDHKTREFFQWQRVFRNTEKIIDQRSTAIQGWID